MRLLLVEDETRMAQALCELLQQEKYEVDHFANGQDGLSALESGMYDIAILDVMLPGTNGFEIARRARQASVRTPILMLTAKAELDDKVMGLDSGADDYLTKPFMTRELLASLRALSRRSINTPDGTLTYGDISLDANTIVEYAPELTFAVVIISTPNMASGQTYSISVGTASGEFAAS